MSMPPLQQKTAVIIGAGPAGLTAALELLRKTDIIPIVLEKRHDVGGISRTVTFDNNRMDIGGHRFFSKSDVVIQWWLDLLPLEASHAGKLELSYQHKKKDVTIAEDQVLASGDDVMLIRKRKSRILYERSFYDYPLVLSFDTLRKLGVVKLFKIGVTYAQSLLFPIKDERTLEDFFINRFGRELYTTFFKTYTEKVWGLPCAEIGADWGRQRVKGLSVGKTLIHSLFGFLRKAGFHQKDVETSLIEYFLYPKYGPGHLWQKAAEEVLRKGGQIIYGADVTALDNTDTVISSVTYTDVHEETHVIPASYVFSTMPIPELFAGFTNPPDGEVVEVAKNLQFRDFITVGLLFKDQTLQELNDNWIYIHDQNVRVGRVQFFHNWSPHLIAHEGTQLVGLEYFCNEGDTLWNMSEEELISFAHAELRLLGLGTDVLYTAHVEKVTKAYPVYAGTYADFQQVVAYLNGIANLYPIGRNGMHRYNNQDHSMLTAMASVEAILGRFAKEDVWSINAEDDYHEER